MTSDLGTARAEVVITEPVLAAVAAHAARAVTGVVRLQPGLAGFAGSVIRSARQRIQGLDPAPGEGVRVTLGSEGAQGAPMVLLEIGIVTSAQDPAAAVAQRVQRTVTTALIEATGTEPDSIIVSIVDIELPGGAR